jgi:hypothetical protein
MSDGAARQRRCAALQRAGLVRLVIIVPEVETAFTLHRAGVLPQGDAAGRPAMERAVERLLQLVGTLPD